MKPTADVIALYESLTLEDREWRAAQMCEGFPPARVTVLTVASLRKDQLRELKERSANRPLALWQSHEEHESFERECRELEDVA